MKPYAIYERGELHYIGLHASEDDCWRVEWWNESARLMLPAGSKLDSFQSYKNGTLMFTIKRADQGAHQ